MYETNAIKMGLRKNWGLHDANLANNIKWNYRTGRVTTPGIVEFPDSFMTFHGRPTQVVINGVF